MPIPRVVIRPQGPGWEAGAPGNSLGGDSLRADRVPAERRALCLRRLRAGRRTRGEHGSILIETALILPILVMLLLGLVSGGDAYQRKLSLQNGAREGARYGATLPV